MSLHHLSVCALLGAALGCSSEALDGPGSGGSDGAGGGTLPESGGSTGSGGSATSGGSLGTGGGAATGGAPAGGGTGGATSGGSGGSTDDVATALSGLRIDDPCAGAPAVSVGATCDHVVLTGSGFHADEGVTLGGEDGTVYDVTLRIRGVVEPANVVGGTRPSTATFSYMSLDWRTEPFTIGGEVPAEDTDYAQWTLRVGDPEETYFLNDYQRVGHYVFELDYEVTIPMAAGTTVALEATDDNERLILNYEAYAPDGVAGSTNHGQFVELDVVSVALR